MSQAVTHKDIDEVLDVLDIMMTRIDERFSNVEDYDQKTHKQIQEIIDNLDIFV